MLVELKKQTSHELERVKKQTSHELESMVKVEEDPYTQELGDQLPLSTFVC